MFFVCEPACAGRRPGRCGALPPRWPGGRRPFQVPAPAYDTQNSRLPSGQTLQRARFALICECRLNHKKHEIQRSGKNGRHCDYLAAHHLARPLWARGCAVSLVWREAIDQYAMCIPFAGLCASRARLERNEGGILAYWGSIGAGKIGTLSHRRCAANSALFPYCRSHI
jgi:hypothetical protein